MNNKISEKDKVNQMYQLYCKLQKISHSTSPVAKKQIQKTIQELQQYLLKNIQEHYSLFCS